MPKEVVDPGEQVLRGYRIGRLPRFRRWLRWDAFPQRLPADFAFRRVRIVVGAADRAEDDVENVFLRGSDLLRLRLEFRGAARTAQVSARYESAAIRADEQESDLSFLQDHVGVAVLQLHRMTEPLLEQLQRLFPVEPQGSAQPHDRFVDDEGPAVLALRLVGRDWLLADGTQDPGLFPGHRSGASTHREAHKPSRLVVTADKGRSARLSSRVGFHSASMVSRVDFLVALALGIAPALVLLWFSLRRFDRPYVDRTLFDDRRVFGGLAVGMVFGVVASVLNLSIYVTDLAGSIALLAGVLFFEELFKVVYMNRRGYRERFDTTFYGVPIGVGVAATSVVATVVWVVGDALYSGVVVLPLMVLFSITLSLVHADSGALIGFGASRGDLWGGFRKGLAVRYAHIALMSPFILLSGQAASPEILIPALLGLLSSIAFAMIVYDYVYRVVLPGTLPEDLRRELRREKRARPVRP